MRTTAQEELEQAVTRLLQTRLRRAETRRVLEKEVRAEYHRRGERRESVIQAAVDARRGKEWATRGATDDYEWERQEVRTWAAVVTAQGTAVVEEMARLWLADRKRRQERGF